MNIFWKRILGLVFFTLLFFNPITSHSSPPLIQNHGNADYSHPLGHPAHGLLIWENDEEFLKRIQESKTNIRMAAFQTTLPNPLPGEEYNVGLAAQMIAGTIIQPGQVFSMNGILGPRTREKGFQEGPAYSGSQIIRVIGGGICKISTTLYNVAILANFEIIERHSHGMLVPYVPPGQDATVSFGTLDMRFRNTTGQPILIWAEKVENTLFMAIYGGTVPPKVHWRHQTLSKREIPIIRRYNPQLALGTERVVQSGAEGIRVKNWLTLEHLDGTVETKELGVDYYDPMPRIIEYGGN